MMKLPVGLKSSSEYIYQEKGKFYFSPADQEGAEI